LKPPTPPSSRELAALALLRVDQGAYADKALAKELAAATAPPTHAARATALAYGAVRLRARCDWVLAPRLKRPLAGLDPWLRAVLRVAAFELLWAEQVDVAAAVHAYVDLARRRGHEGLAAMANAVLRRLAAERESLTQPPSELDPAVDLEGYLCHWASLPPWLARRWRERFDRAQVLSLAASANAEPRVAIRVNRRRIDRAALAARLAAAGFRCEPSGLSPAGLVLGPGARPETLPGFHEGLFTVQDEAAISIAEICRPRPGQRVIDLCAAPGGKATALAELLDDRGQVVACDVAPARLAGVARAAERLGLSCLQLVAGDARGAEQRLAPAAVVLLDAPCSGTGTLARRPDLRWRLGPERLAQVVETQRQLLHSAALLTAPGGVMVYATCSLEPEENEQQMAWLAGRHPELVTEADWRDTTLWPVAGRHDGFFVARRRRIGGDG